ncbi:sensor histidine kinase [Bryocella elongata]|uniref:sensor histidine kinase n=1 Tax=Bryocella elongata TaxID=863522 RepID=UPI00135A4A8D|nr:sensor histidine kinase [Bryocella elongata]
MTAPLWPQIGMDYARTIWRATDGLPEDTVQAIAESTQGELWIATTGGLSLFDGARIRAFSPDSISRMGANSVFSLLVEKDGTVWAGTEGAGLIRIHGGEVKLFSASDGLTDGFIRRVLRDRRRRLWVGTDDGLFVQQGQRFVRFDATGNVPRMAVHGLTEDAQGRVWAGGSELICIAPDGKVTSFEVPGEYSESRVKTILQTQDGSVWVGTVGGLAVLKGDRFTPLPGLHATVRTMLQTQDGTLWIGTIGNGLWRWRNGVLAEITPHGLLPSETILSLCQDSSSQLWIGTQNGMVRLNSTPVHVLSLPRGSDSDFETLSGDTRGVVYVAAQKLYRIEDGAAREEKLPELGPVSVRNVFTSREGERWIGTDGGGAYRISPSVAVLHYSAPRELTNNFIRAFLESRDSAIWIATDEGLSSIGRDGIRKFTEASGLAYFSTRCLLEDRSGTIWIGTDRGLSAWREGHFIANEATRVLAHEKVWSMLEDHAGTLWFATRDHGLFRDQGGALGQITMRQGLPSNGIYQLLEDRRGNLWMTGPNIIASTPVAQMDGPLPTADRPASVTVYAAPFGAEDAQFYGGRQPAGYLAPDDSVWFPSTRGVAHVDHAAAPPHGPPPRAVLLGIEQDGRPTTTSDGVVDARVTRVSLLFSAIDLRPRGDLRLRYKLDGLDHDWIPSGPDERATYTNLKPGHYRFRVQAFEGSQPEQLSEASVAFVKNRVFYQAAWFYVLCLLLAGVLSWAIYQVRIRQIATRFAAVLEERTRLAREIHDTVIQGCTGLSVVLEAMAVEEAHRQSESSPLLGVAREQTRGVIDEARRAVWNMRSDDGQVVDLAQTLRLLAEQTMREHREIRVEVCASHNIDLRAAVHHEVIMVVREAVNNAVQHSGTGRIAIASMQNDRGLEVQVVDDGIGIASDQLLSPTPGHFGLIGMAERMKRLGGTLKIEAASDGGTSVVLRVPVRSRVRGIA